MNKLMRERRGQFVIIAVLMIAIMIISIGALMHRAVTYYRHEPWEEYLALIGNIELNSKRLVELSLAEYCSTFDTSILESNLKEWSVDISKIYPGRGVTIRAHDIRLNHSWLNPTSFTSANATFALDISSIGLRGYKFTGSALLKIMNTSELKPVVEEKTVKGYTINVTVTDENNNPITSLTKENFVIGGLDSTFSVSRLYDEKYGVIYVIECKVPQPSQEIQMIITVYDPRGIKVTSSTYRMRHQTIETKSPTNTSGDWKNSTYAYADDSNYASASNRDKQLYSGYGFAIPEGSQIISVRVGLDVWTEDDEEILLYVYNDGGNKPLKSWSSGTLPKTETTFWVNVTDWADWSAENINSDMIWTEVRHNKIGPRASDIYLDWIRVEVTYIPP